MEHKEVIDALKLLAEYDSLLEQLAKTMGDGFANISRANYHNKDTLRGKYGKDYWDDAYEGQLEAVCDGDDIDIVKKQIKEVSKTESDEKKVRNRKNKTTEVNDKTIDGDDVRNRDYDPILMFGGLSTPSSLRQAQSNFKGCLPLFVQLIKCKQDLIKLTNNDKI